MIPIRQSQTLPEALDRNGVPNQLWTFHGGHEFAGAVGDRRACTDAAIAFTKDPAGFLEDSHPPNADGAYSVSGNSTAIGILK